MCDGLRADKKKTQVKKRSLNPIYNETFHFTLPPHFQQRVPDSTSGGTASGSSYQPLTNQVLLRFVILDWDRVAKNEVMGESFDFCYATFFQFFLYFFYKNLFFNFLFEFYDTKGCFFVDNVLFFIMSFHNAGKVEIGPEVKNDSGVKHWIDVMESPRKQLAVWHSVK